MMNAAQWQAVAEWLGVVWFISNAVVWGLFYRAQAAFVTRAEHGKLGDRVTLVEADLSDIKVSMGKLLTAEQAGALGSRMSEVEKAAAKLLGEMPGLHDQLKATNNLLQMLIQNELKGAAKP